MSDAAPILAAKSVISRVRRNAVLSLVLRILLIAGMTGGFVLVAAGKETLGGSIMGGVIAILFFIATRSIRIQQTLGRAGQLIGMGQFDEAEKLLDEGLRSFILHRKPRQGMLQNLAAMRHGQRRFADAAMLASELLSSHRIDPSSTRPLRLMLAECALELNDLSATHAALSQIAPNMPVREMLKMLELQVDYCVRVNAWPAALDQLPMKIEMAELLPAETAARLQALLGLAALKMGRSDWAAWLKRRAELLTDVPKLIDSRSMLRELWS